jgi:SOS response regulatory protein OraA/RecX
MSKPYNQERLRNYALWYYFKYFPSIKKLNQKLLEKSLDAELTKKVFESIKHLCEEKRVMEDKIRLYLLRNKNARYIKTQLISKGFEKEMIDDFLQKEFFDDEKSLLNEHSIFHKIQNYKNA